jgi:hypothetical protein
MTKFLGSKYSDQSGLVSVFPSSEFRKKHSNFSISTGHICSQSNQDVWTKILPVTAVNTGSTPDKRGREIHRDMPPRNVKNLYRAVAATTANVDALNLSSASFDFDIM